MSIRKHLGIKDDYAAFNREERNLRDAWAALDDENQKRELIIHFLPVGDALLERLRGLSIEDFNALFVGGQPSREHIQSPGRWSVGRYDPSIADNDEFRAVCMFKWAFNAKPDIVIQTGPSSCVCIEAKLVSGEGRYPGRFNEPSVKLAA